MRLSGRLQLSPTPRVVKQLGMIERFAGEWSRIGTIGVFNQELEADASLGGAEASLALDSTAPPGISTFIITVAKEEQAALQSSPHGPSRSLSSYENSNFSEEIPINRHLEQYLQAFQGHLLLNREGLVSLYNRAAANEPPAPGVSPWRKEVEHFRAPATRLGDDELIFPTVSPFLVDQRISELIEWAQNEFQTGSYHPLLIAPVFHLLLLQIHPFPRANHRISLAVLWHLMNDHGFPFVRFQHLSPVFRDRSKAYFSALKQAEKTAGTNWATINTWLEFFFDSTLEVTRNLRELSESLLDEARLSEVQRKILDVVRARGTASRELIAQETGIVISTLKYNLTVLSERGHLKRDGGGRATHYRIG